MAPSRRHPGGTPIGGRFAPDVHSEPGFTLDAESAQPQGSVRTPSDDLILARRTLLTGLSALEPQIAALTLIGAQAVFEHTRHFEAIPMTLTADGDTGVDPSLVSAEPRIEDLMVGAGFRPHPDRPGIWHWNEPGRDPVGFDLLVPESLAGGGGRMARAARVPGQGKRALGRARGLEMAILDRSPLTLSDLDGSGRSVAVHVANPAALLCAKSYKLQERVDDAARGGRDRVKPKDAADVWRLMMTTDPAQVREVFARHETHPLLGAAIHQGRAHLTRLFSPRGVAIDLAVNDLRGDRRAELVRDDIDRWISSFERAHH